MQFFVEDGIKMELPACNKTNIMISSAIYVAPLAKFTKAIAQWQIYLMAERFTQEVLESILALEENAGQALKRLEYLFDIEVQEHNAPPTMKEYLRHLSEELTSICKDTVVSGLEQLANDADSL